MPSKRDDLLASLAGTGSVSDRLYSREQSTAESGGDSGGYIINGVSTYSQGAAAAFLNITVPNGITVDNFVLVRVAGATPAPATITLTCPEAPGFSSTQLQAPTTHTNMWSAWYRVTGVEALDTIVVTPDAAKHMGVYHDYFEESFTLGALGTRGGISQAFVDAPSVNLLVDQLLYVAALERSTNPGAVTGAVNANGSVVDELFFSEADAGSSVVSGYIGEVLQAAPGASGITTVTWSLASTNACAYHILAEVVPGGGGGVDDPTTPLSLNDYLDLNGTDLNIIQ